MSGRRRFSGSILTREADPRRHSPRLRARGADRVATAPLARKVVSDTAPSSHYSDGSSARWEAHRTRPMQKAAKLTARAMRPTTLHTRRRARSREEDDHHDARGPGLHPESQPPDQGLRTDSDEGGERSDRQKY